MYTVMRQELARKRHAEGWPLSAIAAEVKASPEEVEGWLQVIPAGAQARTPAPSDPPDPWDSLVENMLKGRAAGHTLDLNPDVYRGRVRNMLLADGRPAALALVEELDKRFKILTV